MKRALGLLAAGTVACAGTTSEQLASCTLTVAVPDVVTAGEPAVFGLDPVSDRWDIVAHIAGEPAAVLSTDTTGCETCDTCRTDNACDPCAAEDGTCESCEEACATCAPTVTLQVPQIPAGMWPLVVVHRYGQSPTTQIEVSAPTPAGSNDTAAPVMP